MRRLQVARRTRDGRKCFRSVYNHYLGPNNIDHMASKAERKLRDSTCELLDNCVLEVIRTLCPGHTLTVMQNVLCIQDGYKVRLRLEEFKNKCREDRKAFENEAPASTSYQFLYAVGEGDAWLLLEIMMARYLGTEVTTILEATFKME